jgi:branched-chain amino acid transport system ATP-binding protein
MLLKVDGISFSYGDVSILRDVFIEVNEGDIVSVIGSNGAGKSSLLNLISCLLRVLSGKIVFMGHRIDHSAPHEVVERGIVQVPEGRKLFSHMSVLENLKIGSYIPPARASCEKKMQGVFDLFPVLRERKNQKAGSLSGGEQQMLAIGRGLMGVPKLLMLDEISLGLAPIVLNTIFATVKEINSQGITILMVEQNVPKCLSISSQAYVMETGKVVLEGKGSELLNNKKIKAAYLGM